MNRVNQYSIQHLNKQTTLLQSCNLLFIKKNIYFSSETPGVIVKECCFALRKTIFMISRKMKGKNSLPSTSKVVIMGTNML